MWPQKSVISFSTINTLFVPEICHFSLNRPWGQNLAAKKVFVCLSLSVAIWLAHCDLDESSVPPFLCELARCPALPTAFVCARSHRCLVCPAAFLCARKRSFWPVAMPWAFFADSEGSSSGARGGWLLGAKAKEQVLGKACPPNPGRCKPCRKGTRRGSPGPRRTANQSGCAVPAMPPTSWTSRRAACVLGGKAFSAQSRPAQWSCSECTGAAAAASCVVSAGDVASATSVWCLTCSSHSA